MLLSGERVRSNQQALVRSATKRRRRGRGFISEPSVFLGDNRGQFKAINNSGWLTYVQTGNIRVNICPHFQRSRQPTITPHRQYQHQQSMPARQRTICFIVTAVWVLLFQAVTPFSSLHAPSRGSITTSTLWLRRTDAVERADPFVKLRPLLSSNQRSYPAHVSFIAGGSKLVLPASVNGASENSDESTSTSDRSSDKPTSTTTATKFTREKDEKLDMPWSDIQEWALRDNLPKFTVLIPSSVPGGKSKRYAMWRTLSREVTELAGYPIPFLIKMHQCTLKMDTSKENASADNTHEETLGVLPMVDDFEFAPNGGIIGRAYGLPGIADGTRINTPSLIMVEKTVPLGYVTTADQDGDNEGGTGVGFSYELGTCASSSVYSLDGSERSAALLSARRMVVEGMVIGTSSTKQLAGAAKEMAVAGSGLLSDAESNQDLAYLGGATAMLLASATAVGMLSHHLTVNVFWV